MRYTVVAVLAVAGAALLIWGGLGLHGDLPLPTADIACLPTNPDCTPVGPYIFSASVSGLTVTTTIGSEYPQALGAEFLWTWGDGTTTESTAISVTHTYHGYGTYTVTLSSAGGVLYSSASVAVSGGADYVPITCTPSCSLTLGSTASLVLSAAAPGADATTIYTFGTSGLPTGEQMEGTLTIPLANAVAGTYVVTVEASAEFGVEGSGSATVILEPKQNGTVAPLSLALACSPQCAPTVGTFPSVDAAVSGGVAPYVVSWSVLPSDASAFFVTTNDGLTLSAASTTPSGTYQVDASARDVDTIVYATIDVKVSANSTAPSTNTTVTSQLAGYIVVGAGIGLVAAAAALAAGVVWLAVFAAIAAPMVAAAIGFLGGKYP